MSATKSSIRVECIKNLRDPILLDLCARIGNWYVKVAVCENYFTSRETCSKLSHDEDTMVRYAVAQSLRTSKEDLDNLSNDEQWIVRLGVLRNPNTREETRDRLKQDPVLQGR